MRCLRSLGRGSLGLLALWWLVAIASNGWGYRGLGVIDLAVAFELALVAIALAAWGLHPCWVAVRRLWKH